jgi:hypothetical protein
MTVERDAPRDPGALISNREKNSHTARKSVRDSRAAAGAATKTHTGVGSPDFNESEDAGSNKSESEPE